MERKIDALEELHTRAWREEHEPLVPDLPVTDYVCRCGRSVGTGREGRRCFYNHAGRCHECFHGYRPPTY
jgi:hypothetical protein